ncbi:hypothetical protein VFPFJ_10669 [Purpureocillium lilacinum]|uniref:Uncharacterized protein n=1 Tax=Purpureocillium lilacinum TaxID=33203 RepID=A0A179GDK4_PURLI|nr:hypothetical protein VFPFJ_10669 [Purpureocillium lilacinum]OAQ75905.1 hypothetical protein VFPFJ_10669 [Purpureocillium lilacinum]
MKPDTRSRLGRRCWRPSVSPLARNFRHLSTRRKCRMRLSKRPGVAKAPASSAPRSARHCGPYSRLEALLRFRLIGSDGTTSSARITSGHCLIWMCMQKRASLPPSQNYSNANGYSIDMHSGGRMSKLGNTGGNTTANSRRCNARNALGRIDVRSRCHGFSP